MGRYMDTNLSDNFSFKRFRTIIHQEYIKYCENYKLNINTNGHQCILLESDFVCLCQKCYLPLADAEKFGLANYVGRLLYSMR